jgi:hypothetical protein
VCIIENSQYNKMTPQNVGIVFAPTLNVPPPVFTHMIADFDSIFGHASGTGHVGMTSSGSNLLWSASGSRRPMGMSNESMPEALSGASSAADVHDVEDRLSRRGRGNIAALGLSAAQMIADSLEEAANSRSSLSAGNEKASALHPHVSILREKTDL